MFAFKTAHQNNRIACINRGRAINCGHFVAEITDTQQEIPDFSQQISRVNWKDHILLKVIDCPQHFLIFILFLLEIVSLAYVTQELIQVTYFYVQKVAP